jgi:hypothetical protein
MCHISDAGNPISLGPVDFPSKDFDYKCFKLVSGDEEFWSRYTSDPQLFVRAALDTLVVMFDHMRKWIKVMFDSIVLGGEERDEKLRSNREAAASKQRRSTIPGNPAGNQCAPRQRSQVTSKTGGDGAEKFAITTIGFALPGHLAPLLVGPYVGSLPANKLCMPCPLKGLGQCHGSWCLVIWWAFCKLERPWALPPTTWSSMGPKS